MFSALKRLLIRLLPTGVLRQLRNWRAARNARREIQNFPVREVKHTYSGVPLTVMLADPVSQEWYDRDWPMLPELVALQAGQLVPGARVFNLGAHQGVVAALLAQAVGPTGQVIAVEANPHNCEVAQQNSRLNGYSQIQVLNAAVTNESGPVVFNRGLNGRLDDGTGIGGQMVIQGVTVDELATRYGVPKVITIDVEGAECKALAGSSRMLESGPDFFVEVHVGCGLEMLNGTVPEVLAYFPPQRFNLFVRAESDSEFRPLAGPDDPIQQDRFFILARRRNS